MGYLILAIILFIAFFATMRFISRWLYNKGMFGFFLHSLFSLIGSVIMLILSFVMAGYEDTGSILGCAAVYAVVTFLTCFWAYSSNDDEYVTTKWDEQEGDWDSSGHYSGTTTHHTDTENVYSLKNVLIFSLIIAAIWTVVTYFLIETGFAWIPSAIAVLAMGYLTFVSFRAYLRTKK